MIKNNNNEVLIEESFNISRKLEKLIDGFTFFTDPRDGIRDVKIKDITVVSPCESYDFSFAVNSNKKAILDAIRAKNISTNCLAVKEIGLDVIFYDGFLDKRKKRMPIKVKYFNQDEAATKNPTINKYLESWGLVKTKSACQ
jgi:Tat protein secretion system quality control protein TatD with DNase activity